MTHMCIDNIPTKRKGYTSTQERGILGALGKAHGSSRRNAVGRTTRSLARKYKRTERAIRNKYGRLSGNWAP